MDSDYKEIAGFEGYLINAQGDVISNKHKKPRKLSYYKSKDKYTFLRLSKDGVVYTVYLSYLMYWYYHGVWVPKGKQILFKNHDKSDISKENLILGTHKEACNMKDEEGQTPAQKRSTNKHWLAHKGTGPKSTCKYTAKDGTIIIFPSIAAASEYMRVSRFVVTSRLRDKDNDAWVTIRKVTKAKK